MTIRTVSGKVSGTMVLNYLFLVLWLVNFVANAFGFGDYQPPAEIIVIAPAIVAIINLLLRYFKTSEPIAR